MPLFQHFFEFCTDKRRAVIRDMIRMENVVGAPYIKEKGEVIRITHGLGKVWRQCSLSNQSASFFNGFVRDPRENALREI